MTQKINVIVVEDHAMLRDGYRFIFKENPNVHLIDDVENGLLLMESLKQHVPDIIILDHELPFMNGLEVITKVKSKYPQIKFIIVSVNSDEALISAYFMKGANAFISKGNNASVLNEAILSVYKNGNLFTSATTRVINPKKSVKEKRVAAVDFSKREFEILHLLSIGKNNRQIAIDLDLSVKTVEYHKANIYKKTNTHTSAAAIAQALSMGLLNNK